MYISLFETCMSTFLYKSGRNQLKWNLCQLNSANKSHSTLIFQTDSPISRNNHTYAERQTDMNTYLCRMWWNTKKKVGKKMKMNMKKKKKRYS